VVHHSALKTEVYRPRPVAQFRDDIGDANRAYLDAPWCTVGKFRAHAVAVARRFAKTGLIAARVA
jgi:hypothetical protein